MAERRDRGRRRFNGENGKGWKRYFRRNEKPKNLKRVKSRKSNRQKS